MGVFEPPLEALKGRVIAKLFGKEPGAKGGGEDAAGKEAWGKRGGDGGVLIVAFLT